MSGIVGLLLAACGAAQPAAAPTAAPMSGMDHSAMPMDDGADGHVDHGVIPAEGQPYDAAFIDAMIVHHEGAITMANQVLAESERPELRALAEAVVSAQAAEIGQMKAWRVAWYPDLPETSGLAMDMGPMEVAEGDGPFEQRFIEAMIPHHEGALAMARDAQAKAEHQELRDLAGAIIAAQEAEIAQMRGWLRDWYGIE